MSFKPPHELHRRRFGRNMGVGVSLAAFVVLVLALTIVKVTSDDFKFPQSRAAEQN
jgi:hypothetical protein